MTSTLYPVVCAVRDRKDLLSEAFFKSNRLGLLWAAPTGIGIFLFAPDLIHFVIGSRWESAITIIQSLGLVAVVNQIGFNWSAFYRAIGDTRPIAVGALVMAFAVCGVTLPLLLAKGLPGYAFGMAVSALILVGVRLHFLRRLFPLRGMLGNTARGLGPATAALATVGVLRFALGAASALRRRPSARSRSMSWSRGS